MISYPKNVLTLFLINSQGKIITEFAFLVNLHRKSIAFSNHFKILIIDLTKNISMLI